MRRQIEEARWLALPVDVGGKRNEHEVQALEKVLQDEEVLRLMFEEDNEKQRQKLQRIRGERDQLRNERNALRARTYYLEDRIRYLHENQQGEPHAIGRPFPDSWDDLKAWCEQHLGNSVALTTKAIRAARDSMYLNVPCAYEVLLFLAKSSVPSRRGMVEAGNERLEEEKARLGVDISPVGRAAQERRSR